MPASDRSDDLVRIGRPFEGFRLDVVLFEKPVDGGLEIVDGSEDAVLQSPLSEDGEEALDSVEP